MGRIHMDNIKVPERFYFEHGKESQWISEGEAFDFLSKRYRKMGRKFFKWKEIDAAMNCFRRSLNYKKSDLPSVMWLIRGFLLKLLRRQ